MSMTIMSEYWQDVEECLSDAQLIAWDECHKIYVAMDDENADWFLDPDSGYLCVMGTHSGMLEQLREWWEESCALRFIQAVSVADKTTPLPWGSSYETLIPQGAEDEEEEDYDEYL
jgi:hypothetical protein